jgi:hypothetical protein
MCFWSWNLWICYVTCQKRIKIADGSEIAKRPTLLGDLPRLSEWAQCNYKSHNKWNGKSGRVSVRTMPCEKECTNHCGLWQWRGTFKLERNVYQLSFRVPRKENSTVDTLILAQWDSLWIYDLLTCKIIKLHCSKPLNLYIFYTAAIGI